MCVMLPGQKRRKHVIIALVFAVYFSVICYMLLRLKIRLCYMFLMLKSRPEGDDDTVFHAKGQIDA